MASVFIKDIIKNLYLLFLKCAVEIILKLCGSGSFFFGKVLIIDIIVCLHYLFIVHGITNGNSFYIYD